MKITDIKGERAIEVLADILEPSARIFGSKEFKDLMLQYSKKEVSQIQAISLAIKGFKAEIVDILATLDGVEPNDINILTIPKQIMELVNDKELMDFFSSQVQMMADESFGLATENTKGDEK